MELKLEYPTHRIILEHEDGSFITRITSYVQGKVYDDMVTSIILTGNHEIRFVPQERELLNGFLRSLLLLHNKGLTTMGGREDVFDVFKDEMEYYVYCLVNDIKYEEQKWFKTAFIKANIYTACQYVEECSAQLIRTVYPEYIDLIPSSVIPAKPEWKTPPEDLEEITRSIQPKFKCNPKKYESFLTKNDIDYLFHFTAIENVHSIEKNSICSIGYLEDHGISVSKFASSSESRLIDRSKNLRNYVHLSFEQKNPMIFTVLREGRLADYKVYKIDTQVLFLENTMYSKGNVAQNGVYPSADIGTLLSIPFERFHKKVYFNLSKEDRFLFQSEVLVKEFIDRKYIFNL